MEEEIKQLLNTTSITDIISSYESVEERVNTVEQNILQLINPINSKDIIKNNNIDDESIENLSILLDKISDTYIKESTIENLIKIYKKIDKLSK